MDIYEKNLRALSKTHSHLVQMIEETIVDNAKVKVLRKSTDGIEISYRRPDGKTIIFHDDINLSNLPLGATKLLNKKEWTKVILLLGFGLGVYPEHLLKLMDDKCTLVIYEAVPEIFKVIIGLKDLSELLGSERVNLIIGDGKLDLRFIQKHHRDIARGRFYVLKQSLCIETDEAAYEKFRSQFKESKMFTDVNVLTGVNRGAEWSDAFLENIPSIMRTAGVARLKNLFKGYPAIIVSAGPSLEKNIHLLHKAKGRAVIIAVDVVIPTLVPAGIIPDIVVVLESNRTQFLVFQDIPLLRSIPAVFSGEVVHESLSALYPGPTFFAIIHKHPASIWVQRFWLDKGSHMEQFGGSVAHTAFALAQLMGADPIALVAQDLSFREKLHAGEVTELFYPEEYIEQNKKRNPIVKDIFGDERYTLGQFLTFRTAFEQRISGMEGMVYNATEGGLSIKGAETIRLRDFIDEHCNVPLTDFAKVIESVAISHVTCDFDAMSSDVQGDVARLKTIQKDCDRIIKCVKRLKKLKERNLLSTVEAVHLVETIERLEKNVDDPIVKMVAPYRYRIENYLCNNDIKDENLDVIQDSLKYYGELVDAIGSFLTKTNGLIDSLRREAEINILLSDNSLHIMERYFRAGTLHLGAGMVREAATELETAANEFSNFSDPNMQKMYWPLALQVYCLLAQLYIKQYRYYEAREILGVLMSFTSTKNDSQKFILNSREIEEFVNLCNQKITMWKKTKANKESLLVKAEENYGSHIESGAFYYKAGEYDRAARAYINAINEIRTLLVKNKSAYAPETIRLLSAYYGLVETYAALDKQEDALIVLDSALQEVNRIRNLDLQEILEDLGVLYIDLAQRLGDHSKAVSVSQSFLDILPHSFILDEKKRNLMQEGIAQISRMI